MTATVGHAYQSELLRNLAAQHEAQLDAWLRRALTASSGEHVVRD